MFRIEPREKTFCEWEDGSSDGMISTPPDVLIEDDDVLGLTIISPSLVVESFTAQTKFTFDQAYEGKMSCYVIPSSCDGVLSIDDSCVLKGFKQRCNQVESFLHVRSVLTVTVEVPPRVEVGLSVGATMIRPFFPKSFEVFSDDLLEATVQGQRGKVISFSSLLHMSCSVDTKTVARLSRHGIGQFAHRRGGIKPRREWYYILGVDVFDQEVKYVNANVNLKSEFFFGYTPPKLDTPRLPMCFSPAEVEAMDLRAKKFIDLYPTLGKEVNSVERRAGCEPESTRRENKFSAMSHTLLPPIEKPNRLVAFAPCVVSREVSLSCESGTNCSELVNKLANLVVQDIPTNCGKCAMCDTMASMTKHHLVPKEVHNSCGLPKAVMDKTINICRLCHDAIHKYHTNVELAVEFSTIDSLVNLAKKNGRVCRQVALNLEQKKEFNWVGSEGTIVDHETIRRIRDVPDVEDVSSRFDGKSEEIVAMTEVRQRVRRLISPRITACPSQPDNVKDWINDVD